MLSQSNQAVVGGKCIYCSKLFDPRKGQGDHVLPSAVFGDFESDERFRGVCPTCNCLFGRYEQVLAQSSPFGFYRRVVNGSVRRGRTGASIMQRGAYGSSCPVYTARFGERTMLVQPSRANAVDLEPVDQLAIEDEQGAVHFVRLFKGMTTDAVRRKIDALGVKDPKSISCQCDSMDAQRLQEILRSLFPGLRIEHENDIEPGNHLVPTRIAFQFSTEYFQGLAKIAFHYFLVHNRRGFNGDEPIFGELRRFILEGNDEDVERFFTSSGRRFEVPFGERPDGSALTPTRWWHLLAGIEDSGPLVVCMYLFVGPGALPAPVFVTLGHHASSIVLTNGAFAHAFECQPERNDGFAGQCITIRPDKLR